MAGCALHVELSCRHVPRPAPPLPQGRQAVLRQLLGGGRWKQAPWIEPPFAANYGFNIHVGKHFYANFGCSILDDGRVDFGDRVLLGPNVQARCRCAGLCRAGLVGWGSTWP